MWSISQLSGKAHQGANYQHDMLAGMGLAKNPNKFQTIFQSPLHSDKIPYPETTCPILHADNKRTRASTQVVISSYSFLGVTPKTSSLRGSFGWWSRNAAGLTGFRDQVRLGPRAKLPGRGSR